MAIEVAVDVHSDRQLQPLALDEAIAELARRQHGVVARRQLLRIGIGAGAIDLRVRRRRLHPLHRGVYAVGHRSLSPDGRRMAAVLACGAGAALSHRDAAALHGIRHCSRSVFELTVPRKQHPRRGIELHTARLPRDELTTVRAIPLTSVPRTLLDLAAILPRREVAAALHEAEVKRLRDALSLQDLIERHPRHRGAATIAAILAALTAGEAITKETIVALLIDLLDRAHLPRPELNVYVTVAGRTFECDAAWPKLKRMVELDGYAVHGTRRNFESDREHDRIRHAGGWLVIRLTWRQLRETPEAVARDLRRFLGAGGG